MMNTMMQDATIILEQPLVFTSIEVFRQPNFIKFNPVSSYNQYWIHFQVPYEVYEYSQFPQPLFTPRGPIQPNLSFVSGPNLNLKTSVIVSYPKVIQQTVSPFLFC